MRPAKCAPYVNLSPGRYISFTVYTAPVSTNQTYRRGRGHGFYKSPEGRAFYEALRASAGVAAANAGLGAPYGGEVAVRIEFRFPTRRNDLDGPIKPVLDALQGVLYENDRQVKHLEVVKGPPSKERPSVAVEVRAA